MAKADLVQITRQLATQSQLLSDTISRANTSADSSDCDTKRVCSVQGEHPTELSPPSLEKLKSDLLHLVEQAKALLETPREYLHEFVSANWDHSALYIVLQANILQMLPSHISTLAVQSKIPQDKLLRILRLLACHGIVEEVAGERFATTAVSDVLIEDVNFEAWVEFQLFETRIASAHLSDTLKVLPNGYADGQSAFKHGLGSEMYDWHAQRPEKAERFRKAMMGVSQSLDPAQELFGDWFLSSALQHQHGSVVEIGGRYGFASVQLARDHPGLVSEIRVSDDSFLARGEQDWSEDLRSRISFRQCDVKIQPVEDASNGVMAYLVRNLLWNWTDREATMLIGSFLPVMRQSPETVVVICDGMSPPSKTLDADIERAARRRDVTMMVMHNARQRTLEEWMALFKQASERLEVKTVTSASAHVCKALFELRLRKG